MQATFIARGIIKTLRSTRKTKGSVGIYKNIEKLGGNSQSQFTAGTAIRFVSSGKDRVPFDHYEFETLAELQATACKRYTDKPLFGTRNGSTFDWTTYGEFDKMVQNFRKVLHHPKHDIKFDDKVVIISNNRVEWAVTHFAAASMGAPVVPMYEAQMEKDWKYIIEDSDAKVLVVANESIYQKIKNYPGKVGKVKSIICMDADESKDYSYKGWMKCMAIEPDIPVHPLKGSDVATVIYTSGTTGNPKGVELMHSNLRSVVKGSVSIFKEHMEENTSLAFLPWAHVYGMSSELNAFIYNGSALAIISKREEIVECISIVKPTMIVSVPALFNRIYDGVQKNLNKESPMKQWLVKKALSVARKRNHALEYGRPVGFFLSAQFNFFDKIVFSKIRAKFGGNLRSMAAGGAATSMPVLEFFEDIGVPILEGYGLTETSPIISCSGPGWDTRRLGTVGVAIDQVEIMIADSEGNELPLGTDGEVTCCGPNVMKQYRNNPAANDEVFLYKNEKKYFRTGDMGRMVDGKFLKITGRIKEQYKLENGKYVVPAPLEDVYNRSPYIMQSFIYGDNMPHNVILCFLDYPELRNWVNEQTGTGGPEGAEETWRELLEDMDLATTGDKEACLKVAGHDGVRALMSLELSRLGVGVKGYERPAVWAPLKEGFTPENNMLTPKMSIRRNNVVKAYMPIIDGMYTGEQGFKV